MFDLFSSRGSSMTLKDEIVGYARKLGKQIAGLHVESPKHGRIFLQCGYNKEDFAHVLNALDFTIHDDADFLMNRAVISGDILFTDGSKAGITSFGLSMDYVLYEGDLRTNKPNINPPSPPVLSFDLKNA